MFLPCRPCCVGGTPPCGTELEPVPCPASVSSYDCPTFWVEFDSAPGDRRVVIDKDTQGTSVSLLCGTVSVEDENGNTILSASAWNFLPRDVILPANTSRVKVTVASLGIKPSPLSSCGPWDPATPAPLVLVSCPTTRCGVPFDNDSLEVTISADDVASTWTGTGVNSSDASCPTNGKLERRLDGLTELDGVYELTLTYDQMSSSSTWERRWRYDFPAFGCYTSGENYIEVKAFYNIITEQCQVTSILLFKHMEQREKHSGTPTAWSYICSGRGCPTATPCLWYGDVTDAANGIVGYTYQPEWDNADLPVASIDIAPSTVSMNSRPLCDSLSTPVSLSRATLSGTPTVTTTLYFFTPAP